MQREQPRQLQHQSPPQPSVAHPTAWQLQLNEEEAALDAASRNLEQWEQHSRSSSDRQGTGAGTGGVYSQGVMPQGVGSRGGSVQEAPSRQSSRDGDLDDEALMLLALNQMEQGRPGGLGRSTQGGGVRGSHGRQGERSMDEEDELLLFAVEQLERQQPQQQRKQSQPQQKQQPQVQQKQQPQLQKQQLQLQQKTQQKPRPQQQNQQPQQGSGQQSGAKAGQQRQPQPPKQSSNNGGKNDRGTVLQSSGKGRQAAAMKDNDERELQALIGILEGR